MPLSQNKIDELDMALSQKRAIEAIGFANPFNIPSYITEILNRLDRVEHKINILLDDNKNT